VATTGCDKELALGRSAARRGDWAGASQHFVRAVGCEPESAMARGEYGHAELEKGDASVAIDVLREAEGYATDPAVQRAIAHNLATAYEATKASELARRARLRAAAGKDAGPEVTACPVMIVPGGNIRRGTWLEAHAELADWDQVKPASSNDARKRTCWASNLDGVMELGDCAGESEWAIDQPIAPFRQMSRFVFALSEENAAFSVGYTRGGTFCPGGMPSLASNAEARRLGDFLIVESSEIGMQPVAEPGQSESSCVETWVSRDADLFDLHLGRGYSLTALARDVRVELHPEANAITLHGRFCNERIALATLSPQSP
jgi:hypothetical protein